MSKKVCTPFCNERSPCPKHHDLLIALLNCSDTKARLSMDKFESTVKEYMKKGWNKDDDIPDTVETYRFPLIHWASVLGKCSTLEWLLFNGFVATVRTSQNKETALHRCIMCLSKSGLRRPEQKLPRIVELLKDCLMLKDVDSDTPLHIAAKHLARGSKPDYYGQALEVMILQSRVMPRKTAKIIDATNQMGDTIMHILARNDVCIAVVRKVLESGTDLSIKNKADLTPLDVAIYSGSTRIAQALTAHVQKTKMHSKHDSNVLRTESPPESPVRGANEVAAEPEGAESEAVTSKCQEPQEEGQVTSESEDNNHSPQEEEDNMPLAQIKNEISGQFNQSCGQCSSCQESTDARERRTTVSCDSATQVAFEHPLENSKDLDSSLITYLKGAGLLENIKQLATKTRVEDEHALKEKLEALHVMNTSIEALDKATSARLKEIENKEKELEELNVDLKRLCEEKDRVHLKRKLVNEECSSLQTKLHCCDKLLLVVPQSEGDNSKQ